MPNIDFNKKLEEDLIYLATDYYKDEINVEIEEEKYQKIRINLYDKNVLKEILKHFKLKDLGNVFDYPNIFTLPEELDDTNMRQDYKLQYRITASEKYNIILYYSADLYRTQCFFIVNSKDLKKFSNKLKKILASKSKFNVFKNIDLTTKKNEYLEINTDFDDDGEKMTSSSYNVYRKKIKDELLVFDPESEIFKVMNDIQLFFKKETKKMYEDMNIVYKRGIILYGDPGNGKSAMIREIIRHLDKHIIKIIISPNINDFTVALSLLLEALNGRQAIIIIEDIDSLITSRNRSMFLNLLDGVDISSGIYFIGTTNYPDRIDNAFMNRSGRFDKTVEIGNPTEEMRELYFKSRNLSHHLSKFKVYKDKDTNNTLDVVPLFVKYSEGFSMANLKELLISTQYMLAVHPEMSIEESLQINSQFLKDNKAKHEESMKNNRNRYVSRNDDYFDD